MAQIRTSNVSAAAQRAAVMVQGGEGRNVKITLEPPAEFSKRGRLMPVTASACCAGAERSFP